MNEEDVQVIEQAGEKLKELAPNIRMIQDSDTQNALLNGEASVAYLYTSQVTAALAENPDLKVVYPAGMGFGIMNLFIPKNAPDELNAYKFLTRSWSRKTRRNVLTLSDITVLQMRRMIW